MGGRALLSLSLALLREGGCTWAVGGARQRLGTGCRREGRPLHCPFPGVSLPVANPLLMQVGEGQAGREEADLPSLHTAGCGKADGPRGMTAQLAPPQLLPYKSFPL